MGSHSKHKTTKGSAFFKPDGMRVNCDGKSIRDRKPNLKLCSNHYRNFPRIHRVYKTNQSGCRSCYRNCESDRGNE